MKIKKLRNYENYVYIFFCRHANYESYVPIQHWLDRAKIMHGGKYSDSDIEDIKGLFSVLPTLFFITLYCTGYYQVFFIV